MKLRKYNLKLFVQSRTFFHVELKILYVFIIAYVVGSVQNNSDLNTNFIILLRVSFFEMMKSSHDSYDNNLINTRLINQNWIRKFHISIKKLLL